MAYFELSTAVDGGSGMLGADAEKSNFDFNENFRRKMAPGVDQTKLEATGPHVTAAASLMDPPPDLISDPQKVRLFFSRLGRFISSWIGNSIIHSRHYIAVFGAVAVTVSLAYWLFIEPRPLDQLLALDWLKFGRLIGLFIIVVWLGVMIANLVRGDWQLRFHENHRPPRFVTRSSPIVPERVVVRNSAVFIGGFDVVYGFNELGLSVQSADRLFAVSFDRSLIKEIVAMDDAPGWMRGRFFRTAPIAVKFDHGELLIHGAYFEKRGFDLPSAEQFRKTFIEDMRQAFAKTQTRTRS